MILTFTVVRLTFAAVGIPRTRIRLFQPPAPASPPISAATPGDRDPGIRTAGPGREGADETSRT